MLIRPATKIKSSEITPQEVYLNRRTVMAGALGLAAASTLGAVPAAAKLSYKANAIPAPDKLTSYRDATTYNNFYEFGTSKEDPARHAGALTTKPWSIAIDGMVNKPGVYGIEDLIPNALEERIFRLRCVEGWSMVIPWIGFSLSTILNKVEPTSGARYVVFETLVRPEEMRGQRGLFQSIKWPYVEGLRLDEAMNPLTTMVNGMYGEELPNQNGAPLRLMVPWKYGFKSIKSIVRISLTAKAPINTWQQILPNEYGFYANVNPEVEHPRWSQADELVIGGGLLAKRRETEMFNGYADEVAYLYEGMDLRKNF